ncbi:MAG: MSHA biogenesis protein MshO [Pseudohongiellaceae bacterium]|jgi:MSHA biogenesis protein MshO
MSALKQSQGFTLIEMVSVIVLLGILSAGATLFIGDSVRIYTDNTRRSELTHQGRFAIERVSREIRNALPGSIRVQGDCVEFAPIVAASSYLMNVADSKETSLQAVGFDYVAGIDRRVAVYTIDSKDIYIYGRKAVVDLLSVAGSNGDAQRQVNFTNFAGVGHKFRSESPSQRFYIVDQPVSFCVRNNQLVRHEDYGWQNSQATDIPTLGVGLPTAEHIQTIDTDPVTIFTYTPGVLARTSIVHLDMRFNHDDASDEWVRFSHEVFVRNVP